MVEIKAYSKTYSKYFNYTLYSALIVLILCIGIYGYISYENKKAEKEYNAALKMLFENLEKGANNERINKALDMLKHIIKRYPFSRSSELSKAFVGYIYFIKGDYKNALIFYEKFKSKCPESIPEYRCLSELAISSCYEAKKDIKSAIRILKKFLDEYPKSPFREFALLNLARLYELDNNINSSKEAIKKFIKEYPQSPFFYMAKAKLLAYNN